MDWKKKTVMIAMPVLLVGGIEMQVMTLIGTLISAGHRAIICCDYEFEESVVRLMKAEEFMNIMIKMVEMAPSEDFVLASEVNTYARTFVKEFFAEYVLDYLIHFKEHSASAPGQDKPYKVVLEKLKKHLGHAPTTSISTLCRRMLAVKFGI